MRNVERIGHQPRIAAHQRDSGRVHRDISARRHRNPDIGRRQRGRVVDAVAHHCHRPPGRAQLAHRLGLAVGQDVGEHLRNAERSRHGLGRAFIVAGQHHRAHAPVLQRRHGLSRHRLGFVAKGQEPAQPLFGGDLRQPRNRPTFICQRIGARLQRPRFDRVLGHQSAAAKDIGAPTDHRLHAAPGQRLNIAGRGHRQPTFLRGIHHRARQRMLAPALDRGGDLQKRCVVDALCSRGIDQHRLALGQRAGLVERHQIDAVRHFQRFGVLDQYPRAGRNAGARHDRGRRRKAQRARAGDDEHRDGIEHRHVDARTRHHPADKGYDGHRQHHGHEHRAHPVHQPLDRRLGALRAFDKAHDLRQHGFAADRGRLDKDQPLAVDRPANDQAALGLRHRQAFARQHRFIDARRALEDPSVNRNALARADADKITLPHAFNAHLALGAPGIDDARGFGAQRHQRADRRARLTLGAAFQPFAEQHQRDDDGRSLEIIMRRAVMRRRHRELIDAQPISRARPDRDEQVHIARTRLHRAPPRAVESRAQPELHRRCKQPLNPSRHVEHNAERREQHGEHQRQGQHRADDDMRQCAFIGIVPDLLGRHFPARRIAARRRRITRLGDSLHQHIGRHGREVRDLRGFARQIDGRAKHPRHYCQRAFDPADARGTAHAGDRHLAGGDARRIARARNRVGNRLPVRRAVLQIDLGPFAGEVHHHAAHARHHGQRALDPAGARRAAHPLHGHREMPLGLHIACAAFGRLHVHCPAPSCVSPPLVHPDIMSRSRLPMPVPNASPTGSGTARHSRHRHVAFAAQKRMKKAAGRLAPGGLSRPLGGNQNLPMMLKKKPFSS